MLYVHIRIIMPEFTYLHQPANKQNMLKQDKVENYFAMDYWRETEVMMTMLLDLVIVNKSSYLSLMPELNMILVLMIQNTDFG